MPTSESSRTLRLELEEAIRNGRCAYCRRPASPQAPLTREHVIPRAKGGSRRDARIIVPACARCNQRRGCRELVLFLLTRPRRISAFLDHLGSLSPESIRAMDVRVFAELYAAVWILNESLNHGPEWRAQLRRLCSGRTLHRRRYAARRLMGEAGRRLGPRELPLRGPSCPLPSASPGRDPGLEESLDRIRARLLGILALAWQAPGEEVWRALSRPHAAPDDAPAGVVELDGWKRAPRRRRARVDQRRGRPPRRRAA